jgi:hypothetical protein
MKLITDIAYTIAIWVLIWGNIKSTPAPIGVVDVLLAIVLVMGTGDLAGALSALTWWVINKIVPIETAEEEQQV